MSGFLKNEPPCCPTTDAWCAFLRGDVSADILEWSSRHLEECASCLSLVRELSPRKGQPPGERRGTPTVAFLVGTMGRSSSSSNKEAEPMPTAFGRFQVVARVGAGAFGTVYKAHDPKLKRDVAVKMTTRDRLGTSAAMELFLKEGQALARLNHPGIVPVYDVGQTAEGDAYLVSQCGNPGTYQDNGPGTASPP